MKLFLATLQFLTRVPVPDRWTKDLTLDDYAKGVIYFPLIGLVAGIVSALAYQITVGSTGIVIAAIFAVLANALITGAFHLDGLADTCDGIFSARKREQMLEIMRDSRIGTNGALALVMSLLLRVALICQLAQSEYAVLPALIAAPIIARSLLVILMYQQRYARENGMGNIYVGKICGKRFIITLIAGMALVLTLCGWHGVMAALVTLLLAYAYRYLIQRKLGGQTGDTMGAGNEVFEILFLLALL